MKIKKAFSLVLTLAILLCAIVIPVNAAETEAHEKIEIIIENNNISEETQEKIIAFYSNGGEETEASTTYGLTCTLLGHDIEGSIVTTVNHKVRSSSPRCLKKTYRYDSCTRCDYEESTLITSMYIVCC